MKTLAKLYPAMVAGLFFFSGCATNSFLQTAKTLEPGEIHAVAGVAANGTIVSPVVAASVGVAPRLDASLRGESGTATATLRFQLLREEENRGVNLLLLVEGSTSPSGKWASNFGPGIAVGKTFGDFEPYLAYVVKYGHWLTIRSLAEDPPNSVVGHFVKGGARYNIPGSAVFLQLEGGVAIWNLLDSKVRSVQSMSDPFALLEGAGAIGIRF